MASTAWRKDTQKKRMTAEEVFYRLNRKKERGPLADTKKERKARKKRIKQAQTKRELQKEHFHESFKAQSRHLDSRCQDACDHYLQRAINDTEFGQRVRGEKYFDLYNRCKRSCYDTGLGRKYRKKRGWEVTGKKTHRKPPTGRVGALRGTMKSGTKVMLGVGALAVAGIGYYLWSRGKQVADPDYNYGTDSVPGQRLNSGAPAATLIYAAPGVGTQMKRRTGFANSNEYSPEYNIGGETLGQK